MVELAVDMLLCLRCLKAILRRALLAVMVSQGQSDYERGKTIPADQVLKELDNEIARDFAK